jgi:hypothetical protein
MVAQAKVIPLKNTHKLPTKPISDANYCPCPQRQNVNAKSQQQNAYSNQQLSVGRPATAVTNTRKQQGGY